MEIREKDVSPFTLFLWAFLLSPYGFADKSIMKGKGLKVNYLDSHRFQTIRRVETPILFLSSRIHLAYAMSPPFTILPPPRLSVT